jgi:TolB protein
VVVTSHPFVAGEVVRRELSHQGFAMLAWNPVSDVVALMSPPQASPHWFGPIRVLDAADGLLEPVMDEVALAFFWSPDGNKLAWLSPVAAPDVQQVADVRTGSPRGGDRRSVPVQRVPVRLRLRVVDMDGVRSGAPRTLTTFSPSAAFVNQFLPFFDQYALSHRIWSPNSDALVLPMVGSDGVTRVVVVGLDGAVREIAQGDMPFWNVR